jgi:undecaprenol kinase
MIRFFKNIGFALTGCLTALKTERSFRIQVAAMLIVITVGLYLQLSLMTWGLVIIAIGFVLTAELINTALERLSDQISNGKIKPLIKQAKDVSAGAVLVAALSALVIGILFLIIPLIQKIADWLKG